MLEAHPSLARHVHRLDCWNGRSGDVARFLRSLRLFHNFVGVSTLWFTGHLPASDIPPSPLRLSSLAIVWKSSDLDAADAFVPLSTIVDPQTLRSLEVMDFDVRLLADMKAFVNLRLLDLDLTGEMNVLPADVLSPLVSLRELIVRDVDTDSVLSQSLPALGTLGNYIFLVGR